jgi:hypothetical protein
MVDSFHQGDVLIEGVGFARDSPVEGAVYLPIGLDRHRLERIPDVPGLA